MLFYALCFVGLQLVALGFAFLYSIRARIVPSVAALVLLLYVTLAATLSAIPPHVELPGVQLLEMHWLVHPLLGTALAGATAWIGFRRSASEWDGTEAKNLAERAGFAGLGLTLLYVATLLLVALGQVAADGDAP